MIGTVKTSTFEIEIIGIAAAGLKLYARNQKSLYSIQPFEGHFTSKSFVHLWQKSFVFKRNPSKIRKNSFVLTKSRTLFE